MKLHSQRDREALAPQPQGRAFKHWNCETVTEDALIASRLVYRAVEKELERIRMRILKGPHREAALPAGEEGDDVAASSNIQQSQRVAGRVPLHCPQLLAAQRANRLGQQPAAAT